MRLLVSGTRRATAAHREVIAQVIGQVVAGQDAPTLIHGDARGVDRIAAGLAAEWGWPVDAYPAEWQRYGRAAGPLPLDVGGRR